MFQKHESLSPEEHLEMLGETEHFSMHIGSYKINKKC